MAKYTEISEKERLLREILHSARLITGKREFCRETLSGSIEEKGGIKGQKRGKGRDCDKLVKLVNRA